MRGGSSNSARFQKTFFGGESMSKKIPTQETIKRATIRDMKDLGIHKPQYNRIIDVYAGLVHQYLLAVNDWEESGCLYETKTAAGNPKKSGIVDSMEKLRKDVLAYSDRLCLNPKSLETVTAESEKKSVLGTVLSQLE